MRAIQLLFFVFFIKSLHFNLCLSFVVHADVVQEVEVGKTAVLHCPSNDEEHNFMFWQLADDTRSVIGPGNDYNKTKYEYEILTGKLIIKNVSPEEDGVLNCVSKGVRNDDINIRTVRMVVKKDWEEVYEDDPHVNALRVFILLGFFVIIIGGGYLIYQSWITKPEEHQLFLGIDEDDDSNEELFSQPGPSYRHSRSRTPSPSINSNALSFKSVNSEISLHPSEQTSQSKQTSDGSGKKNNIYPFDPFGDDEPNFNF